jgi:hypothetical protein
MTEEYLGSLCVHECSHSGTARLLGFLPHGIGTGLAALAGRQLECVDDSNFATVRPDHTVAYGLWALQLQMCVQDVMLVAILDSVAIKERMVLVFVFCSCECMRPYPHSVAVCLHLACTLPGRGTGLIRNKPCRRVDCIWSGLASGRQWCRNIGNNQLFLRRGRQRR